MTNTAWMDVRSTARTAASSTWVVSASWGRNVEVKGAPEAVEERHARGGLLVAHVRVGELREGGERRARPARACQLGAVAQRLARRRAGARRRRRGRRAWRQRRAAGGGPAAAAARSRGEAARSRRSGRRRGAASLLPQPGDDRLAHRTRRATTPRRPGRASASRPRRRASDLAGVPARARATRSRRRGEPTSGAEHHALEQDRQRAPAGAATRERRAGEHAADGRPRRPRAARSSATAPRRSRAVIASAWTSAYRQTSPIDQPDAAQHGGERCRGTRRCSWSRRRPAPGRRPERAQLGGDRGPVGAGGQADRERRAEPGLGARAAGRRARRRPARRFSSARTTPATRSRISSPPRRLHRERRARAAARARRRGRARPRPRRAARSRRPEASGGASKRVWSPG